MLAIFLTIGCIIGGPCVAMAGSFNVASIHFVLMIVTEGSILFSILSAAQHIYDEVGTKVENLQALAIVNECGDKYTKLSVDVKQVKVDYNATMKRQALITRCSFLLFESIAVIILFIILFKVCYYFLGRKLRPRLNPKAKYKQPSSVSFNISSNLDPPSHTFERTEFVDDIVKEDHSLSSYSNS